VVSLDRKGTIDDALERIAGAAGWNLVANTGRTGDRVLVLTVKGAPVEEALDAVLEGTPLVATRRGNTVTVSPGALPPPAEAPVLAGFDRPTGKKFSGDFDEESVEDALRKVSEAAGLSVVFPPGLRGAVSAHFKEVPVEEVLRVLLGQAGLVAQREGSILTVKRAGGARVVIRGGKRHLQFQGEFPDVGADIAEAVNDAMREAEEAREEGRTAVRERRRRPDKIVTGDHTVGPGERAQEVVVFRGNVRMEPGSTADQVTAIAGSIDLGPGVQVEREVVAILGDVHVSPGAHVGGDAVAIGGKITIDEGAQVEGQQTSIDIPGIGSLISAFEHSAPSRGQSWALKLGAALAKFAMFFALGLLFLLLVPRRVDAVGAALAHAPVKTVLTGLVGTFAMPVLGILLVVTIIGIPLVAVQALAVAVAGVLGFSALALHIGRSAGLRLERGGEVLRLAIGTALLVAIGSIPVLGAMAWVTAWLFVFGAVIRTRFGQSPAAPLETTAVPPAPPAAPAGGPAAP
jgi:hypothetical protein